MFNRKTILIALSVVVAASAGYYYFYYRATEEIPIDADVFADESEYISILSKEEQENLNEYRQLKRIKFDLKFLNNPFFKELKDIVPKQPPADQKGRLIPFLPIGGLGGVAGTIQQPAATTTKK